jgi:hypothetical protein
MVFPQFSDVQTPLETFWALPRRPGRLDPDDPERPDRQ